MLLAGSHFPAPQSLDTHFVDLLACLTKQCRDTAVTILAMLTCQFNHVSNETVLVLTSPRHTTLRRPVLAQHPKGLAFRHSKNFAHMIDKVTTTARAQQFPLATSITISLANVRSETAQRSRPFSFSSSLRCFNWSVFNPPYSCASDGTSLRLRRSRGSRLRSCCHVGVERQPGSASQQSLRVCKFSSTYRSTSGSKKTGWTT